MTVQKTILIVIAGGHASGKKCVQVALKEAFQVLSPDGQPIPTTALLHLVDFLSPNVSGDLECLDAYDLDALVDVVRRVRAGEDAVTCPIVDVKNMRHLVGQTRKLPTAPDVLIVEGCYVLGHKPLVAMADVKIFVDCDPDVRLARRVMRDLEERQLPLDTIFDQHVRCNKASFEMDVLPTKTISDIILPSDSITAGVELIAQGVMDDIRRGRKTAGLQTPVASRGASATVAAVTKQLPVTLSEADLISGTPSYYDTV
ncbi:P-loop containing nucleoside triphosphate hydrolase protein [Geopyxis carbonaria]|nr:P-loop containing nucleoside triphosphate hydrolase protein [Geopyxis carbonaria]